MKSFLLIILFVNLLSLLSSCSTKPVPHPQPQIGIHTREINAFSTPTPQFKNINERDYDFEETPITYVIDISTEEGRAKLRNISVQEAYDLVLIEAIMKNKCANIFHPQFTHLEKNGQVLRVIVYGFPAHYKKK
ncbi:MAG: hypothetical protein K2K25_09925 [Muribaculaceae bacterium]|nr:hypothetical protein [Muribaculaceae bacterium]